MCFLISSKSIAQQNTLTDTLPKNQLEFRHDNDFILLTDRYYSSGLFATYRRRLSKGLFHSDREQISISLAQKVYTPSDIESFDIKDLDRPYAGLLELTGSWSTAFQNEYIKVELSLGLIGAKSGAGAFQRWYHENIVLFKVPNWTNEITNSYHANLEFQYIREWQLAPNPFSVHIALAPSAAAGTKDVYLQPEVIAYFGRRNALNQSMAYNQLGSLEREIYFSFRANYRFVGYNALLEGDLPIAAPSPLVPLKRGIFELGFDLHHRSGKNHYKVGYRSTTKETERTNNHQYLILAYGRSF